ncbi:DUF3732 domain-containing protein [Pontibacter pudoricolor]|uniref:DUF3732 domain-containing protein n=1 Tax=Pontibacter pudoricolor TaxID=2694930 RepID=UPI001392080D|nr:DUF3732 domain-containing protein [Pontibacter pudoricolor]
MSFQIKTIALYNAAGDIRTLDFKIGGVNIITGKSRTGKSSIIEILDYCLGRSTFNVFEGVNRGIVTWYAVILQIGDMQALIAKPAPEGLATSQSKVYWETGSNVNLPELKNLEPNSNDDAVVANLSGLLGLGLNKTVIAEGRTTTPFEATLKHTKFYLFQEQNLIANKRQLFWRQADPFMSQSIKDTLPYFLGAIQEDRLLLEHELKELSRSLRQLQQKQREALAVVSEKTQGARTLIAEAQAAGIIDPDTEVNDENMIELLRGIASWSPNQFTGPDRGRLEEEQKQMHSLRTQLRKKAQDIVEVENFQRESSNFSYEVKEQVARLEVANLFNHSNSNEQYCPICESSLEIPTPSLEQLNNSLIKLRANLESVRHEKPRVDEHLIRLRNDLEEIRREYRASEERFIALNKEQDTSQQFRDAQLIAARVAGRASLYIESINTLVTDQGKSLNDKIEARKLKINQILKGLELEEIEDVITSILSIVSSQMTKWADHLNLEHKGFPYRLDIKKLTVVADTPDRPIVMERMGSGENHLGCHLIALLSLHKYFISKKRPVPSFIVLDQPTQVYFPSSVTYKALDGTNKDLGTQGADELAVRRMFELLFDVCDDLFPNFQIIVTEHANLDDERFQEALVEDPWTDGKALIPESWLTS